VRASEQGRPGNLIDLLDSPTKNLVEKCAFLFMSFAFHDIFHELQPNCAAVTASSCLFSLGYGYSTLLFAIFPEIPENARLLPVRLKPVSRASLHFFN